VWVQGSEFRVQAFGIPVSTSWWLAFQLGTLNPEPRTQVGDPNLKGRASGFEFNNFLLLRLSEFNIQMARSHTEGVSLKNLLGPRRVIRNERTRVPTQVSPRRRNRGRLRDE